MHSTVWESKSTILGLILYFTLHAKELSLKRVGVSNPQYRHIIQKLFPDWDIKKKAKRMIWIQQLADHGVCLNQLGNLTHINRDTFYLLPWFDSSNPLVMVVLNGNTKDIVTPDVLLKEIKTFDRTKRQTSYGIVGLNMNGESLDNWDTYYELKILNEYSQLYGPTQGYRVNVYLNRLIQPMQQQKNSSVSATSSSDMIPMIFMGTNGSFQNYTGWEQGLGQFRADAVRMIEALALARRSGQADRVKSLERELEQSKKEIEMYKQSINSLKVANQLNEDASRLLGLILEAEDMMSRVPRYDVTVS